VYQTCLTPSYQNRVSIHRKLHTFGLSGQKIQSMSWNYLSY